MKDIERAAIEAHKRLSDGDGLTFYNMFHSGAEYVLKRIEGAAMNGLTSKQKYNNVLEVIYELEGWERKEEE